MIPLIIAATLLAPNTAEWRADECRYSDGDGWSTYDVRQTLRCATEKWSVSGGYDKALSVALCESTDLLDPGGDGYAGPFQQSERYWNGRRAYYQPSHWKPLARSPANPRANVVVSVRQIHQVGYEPWEAGVCA